MDGLYYLNSKFNKSTLIKTVWYWQKDWQRSTEWNGEPTISLTCTQSTFNKGTLRARKIFLMKGGETIRYSTYKTLSNWNLNILQHCSCPIQQSELFYLFIFKYILLIMLLQLSHFPPFIPLYPAHSHPHSPPLVHIHGSYV